MKKIARLEKNKKLTPFAILATIFLTLYSLLLILPLMWAVFTSLKLQTDFVDTVFAWPKYGFQWQNWVKAFTEIEISVLATNGTRKVKLFEMFIYSFIYCVSTSFISVFSRSACAYIVAKYKHLKWPTIIHTIVIILMTISFPSNLAITIKFYKITGLYNNFVLCCFMSFGFSGVNFLYFYASYCGLSREYSEAAEIDGANQFVVMLKIMMPMVKNIFIALFMLEFIASWNNYSISLVYLPSYPMVAYGLYRYQFMTGSGIGVPLKLSGCALVIIPTLTLFIIFRNKIISNLSIGGLKG